MLGEHLDVWLGDDVPREHEELLPPEVLRLLVLQVGAALEQAQAGLGNNRQTGHHEQLTFWMVLGSILGMSSNCSTHSNPPTFSLCWAIALLILLLKPRRVNYASKCSLK